VTVKTVFASIAMREAGAGVFLRAARVTPAGIRAAVERVMREASFKQAAQRVAESFTAFDPHARFRATIDEVIAQGGSANGPIRSTAVTQISGQSEPV